MEHLADNANGTIVSESAQFNVPTSMAAGIYNFSVERISPGGCITSRANSTITVYDRPINGTISTSATTICYGEAVTISGSGGVGELGIQAFIMKGKAQPVLRMPMQDRRAFHIRLCHRDATDFF